MSTDAAWETLAPELEVLDQCSADCSCAREVFDEGVVSLRTPLELSLLTVVRYDAWLEEEPVLPVSREPEDVFVLQYLHHYLITPEMPVGNIGAETMCFSYSKIKAH